MTTETSSNPLLSGLNLKIPGRTFTLPSRGLFYTSGELKEFVKQGDIHVRPMSAFDEITMKNADLLLNGDAVREVFAKCVDGVINPDQLLARDIDAIMLFLRTVTYGPQFEFYSTHNCKDAKQHSYSTDLELLIKEMSFIDPTTLDKQYSLELSQTGNKIRLRPARYCDTMEIVRLNHGRQTLTINDEKQNLMLLLLSMIESVDTVTDRKLISEWLGNLSSPLTSQITDKIASTTTWGTNLQVPVKCQDCGTEYKVEIPLNPVGFFNE